MSETKETTKPEVTQEVKSEGGDMKMKSKPKMKKFNATKEEPVKVDLTKDPNVKAEEPVKVDLTKKTEDDAIQIGETKEVPVEEPSGNSNEMGESVQKSSETTEGISPLQEVTEEEVKKEETVEQPQLQPIKKVVLPDNVEKLVKFMEETGGDIQDYVRLNADYSNVNEDALLKEYYKNTKPHLTDDEVSFLMEDQFTYDTDTDEERDIRKIKLAKKEAVAEARNHLESLKQKYYDEIKLRPGVTQEQQKAMDFFNRYNNEQEIAEQKHKKFIDNTKQLFSNDFKGFDFQVGDKKFRYGVKDPNAIAENQSNLNNFVEKFLDNEGNVKDTKGYHKAMYAAQNIDRIVNHFYEQGKSDGIKNVVEGSKNPSTEARQTSGDIFIGGLKVKAIDGVDSSKLRIKRSKFNN
jgi:hypothetical protein|tara:strand:+ start:986 stop:2206 length:1221 start_codon:yes stop_codon:yes gene_type:complete